MRPEHNKGKDSSTSNIAFTNWSRAVFPQVTFHTYTILPTNRPLPVAYPAALLVLVLRGERDPGAAPGRHGEAEAVEAPAAVLGEALLLQQASDGGVVLVPQQPLGGPGGGAGAGVTAGRAEMTR